MSLLDCTSRRCRNLVTACGVLLILGGIGAAWSWYKFFHVEPQPAWVTNDPEMRFKYGSIGAERIACVKASSVPMNMPANEPRRLATRYSRRVTAVALLKKYT